MLLLYWFSYCWRARQLCHARRRDHRGKPGTYIGFAGPRVMEKTIRQKLPPGLASAESMLAHGMIDMVCSRAELRA